MVQVSRIAWMGLRLARHYMGQCLAWHKRLRRGLLTRTRSTRHASLRGTWRLDTLPSTPFYADSHPAQRLNNPVDVRPVCALLARRLCVGRMVGRCAAYGRRPTSATDGHASSHRALCEPSASWRLRLRPRGSV